MRFTQYDLGFQETGSVVEVTLSGTEANVQLLDSTALTNSRRGEAISTSAATIGNRPSDFPSHTRGSGTSPST